MSDGRHHAPHHPAGEPRFPGYNVLDESDHWDDTTKGVVLRRLGPPPPIAFFTPEEEAVVRPLVDRLLGMDAAPRVPVVEMLDAQLQERQGPGYRHEDMPEDWDAWRRSLHALDADARRYYGTGFASLTPGQQRDVLRAVQAAEGDWHGLPAAKVWSLWMRSVCQHFYSHPWAWNEIGFGGPAYPRGYRNHTLVSSREPWEVAEVDAFDPVPWADRIEQAERKQH